MKNLYKGGFAIIPVVVIVLIVLAGGWFYLSSKQIDVMGPGLGIPSSSPDELIGLGPKEVYLKFVDDTQYIKNKTGALALLNKYATKEMYEFASIIAKDENMTESKFLETTKENNLTRDQIISVTVGGESKQPSTGEKIVNLTIKTLLPGDKAEKKQGMVWRDGRWQFGLGF